MLFKLPKPFYNPDDGSGAVKLNYKFRGEEEELDLTDPEQYERAKALIEKGRLYDEKMHELGELKRKAESFDAWNELLEGVREGEVPQDEFLKTLEQAGIKLTKSEQAALADDIEFGTDEVRPTIVKKMEEQLSNVQKKLQEFELKELANEIKNAHNILSKKYNGLDGMPKYDPEKVAQYAVENQIFSRDPVKQYELAYFDMNREAILEAQKKSVTDSKLKQKLKREKAFAENGASNFVLPKSKSPKDLDENELLNLIDDDKLYIDEG